MRLPFQLIAVFFDRMVMPFFFLIVAVHHPLGGDRTFAEGTRLLQQAIDESGLAVIDVGDDGDIAEVFNGHREGLPGVGIYGK
jgi:hypothetical protein